MGTCRCANVPDMPNVSCADFITSLLLGWLHHHADALMCRHADAVTWLFQQCQSCTDVPAFDFRLIKYAISN